MHAGVYKRRTPKKSELYNIAYQYFEAYEKIYPERCENEYGYFRKIITSTISKYLDCGIMENGFARIRCPDCGHDFFVAFSCKTRFFCPSCAEKRTLIWGEWVKENILKNVSHRQWVFTIPKVLRKLFYKDRLLLSELARCAAETILELYRAIFPDNHFRTGIIASTQTFGDLLIWHPHIHCNIGKNPPCFFLFLHANFFSLPSPSLQLCIRIGSAVAQAASSVSKKKSLPGPSREGTQ